MVLSNLLRERAIENTLADHGILSITAAQQLSLAVMIFAAAEFIGFTSLWSHLSSDQTRRRHRYLRAVAAALAIGFQVILGYSLAFIAYNLGGWLFYGFAFGFAQILAIALCLVGLYFILRPAPKVKDEGVEGAGAKA